MMYGAGWAGGLNWLSKRKAWKLGGCMEAEKQKTKWMVEVNYSDSKIDLLNCDCRTIDIKVPVFISL